MRQSSLLFLLISLICKLPLYSQFTFAWSDTTFEIGSSRIIQLQFALEGPCTTKPCYDFLNNASTLDTLLTFLQKNPSVKIEIAYHTDTRGSADYHLEIATRRAEGIKDELLFLGVDADQFITKGYGKSKPLLKESDIKKIKNKAKRDDAYRKNQRIEVIITAL